MILKQCMFIGCGISVNITIVKEYDKFKDLIISRKRKKYKFANFDDYKNCFSHRREDDGVETHQRVFDYLSHGEDQEKPVVLEIAAGNAQFSLQMARKYPDTHFIAIDIKSDRLYTSAKAALEEGVENIAFLRTHLNELGNIFKSNSIETIWLTFPDPYPKKRSAKHRLTHVSFLRQYRNILNETSELKFKTDNLDLFLWSLEQLVNDRWHFLELSFDLHDSNLKDDYKITTYYEQRYVARGEKIKYVTAKPVEA
ncbi:MAG: tRNA (guanine-N7-)-methyltransferase [Patescibacteria group bacterium]|nr:tRNA (guanine-N7-)-methyltransferase [Patescibacteria group bacterium]